MSTATKPRRGQRPRREQEPARTTKPRRSKNSAVKAGPEPKAAPVAPPKPKAEKIEPAPKPHPPMRVFVASSGNTSFIITARDAADAREFLGKIRDGVKGMKFRMIDQTLRQVWGLFPIMEVVIDGEGRVDIKKMPAIEQEESADGEAKQDQ